METVIISLGGSLIVPGKVDVGFLSSFKKMILAETKKNKRFILICGGGNTCREYQSAVKNVYPKVTNESLDLLGIKITEVNAELVKYIFAETAENRILKNPTVKIKTNKKIIIGCGWKPGCSSDKDAVLAAKTFGAKTVINLSNISYVYDKNPSEFKDAKPIKEMNWPDFRKIVGNKWVPGAHLPFDPIASRLAHGWKLKLVVMKGDDLKNMKSFLDGKKFIGTVIS